jgi:hypothetical protein
MISSAEHYLIEEIEKIAQISAETFSYYKIKNPNAGNYYVGKNEIEGQCSDYALKFVLLWNEKHPENIAEIVAVNQDLGIKSGSYIIVKEIINFQPSYFRPNISCWIVNPAEENGIKNKVLYHPNLGFYEVEQARCYNIKKHFDEDMANKGPHVWAKVGDISVDPCWADTDNKPFIGIDIIDLI